MLSFLELLFQLDLLENILSVLTYQLFDFNFFKHETGMGDFKSC